MDKIKRFKIFNRNIHFSITATLVAILLGLASLSIFVVVGVTSWYIRKKFKESKNSEAGKENTKKINNENTRDDNMIDEAEIDDKKNKKQPSIDKSKKAKKQAQACGGKNKKFNNLDTLNRQKQQQQQQRIS